ncbi:MAG: TSUP family transporter [Clostridia bacterium]|nr:TSUP family transporter [Clostridia bacterium]
MTVTLTMYLIVCPLAFLAGFVDSVAGGGGLISLPAYYLAGLSPVMAAGTNKLSACLGTLAASLSFMKGGQIIWKVALPAAAAALPGSWLGTTVLQHIPEDAIRWMMIMAIPLVAAVVLRKKGGLQSKARVKDRLIPLCSLGVGLVIGFYDGLVGPGTGTFLILAFTMLMGVEAVHASGSAKIVNLASNVASMITLAFSGQVIWALGLPVAAFAIMGNLLGARMTMKKGVGFIRGMLLCVMGLLLAKMLWDVVS